MKAGRSGAAALAAAALLAAAAAGAQDKPAAGTAGDKPPPRITPAMLRDPANVRLGESVWTGQCRHCHGSSAYPGKAPKLRPATLEPDFIFDRVSNGFRGMPAWKDVYTTEQIIGVVSYIKSDSFSP